MNYVGIDLHEPNIVLCVMNKDLKVLARRTFPCRETEAIVESFRSLGEFKAAVEATASYEWLVESIEPLAKEVVLVHPGKLRVIAESTKETDKLDAQVIAASLARDQIPRAYRPTKRQREHRALVRHRRDMKRLTTSLKGKIRRIASDFNADRRDLFTPDGWKAFGAVKLSDPERFVVDPLDAELRHLEGRLKELAARLKAFAAASRGKEAEARAKLATIPGVGPVTIDVVVSELGDVSRSSSSKEVCAYAGLSPAVRQSNKKSKDLPITETGSPLLRRALVEAAWRVIRQGAAWRRIYEGIKRRAGGKEAIVAVARRLLVVMTALLRDGTSDHFAKVGEPPAT